MTIFILLIDVFLLCRIFYIRGYRHGYEKAIDDMQKIKPKRNYNWDLNDNVIKILEDWIKNLKRNNEI